MSLSRRREHVITKTVPDQRFDGVEDAGTGNGSQAWGL